MKNFNCIKALLTAVISGAAIMAMPTAMASADSETDVSEKDKVDFVTQFGDVNFDSSVNVSDAVQMRRFLLGSSEELGNWKNADLDADEDIDVFDYILLGKQLTGKAPANSGSLRLKVVDMMSGEPLESVDVELFGLCDDYCYDVGRWTYTPEDDTYFTGLPTDGRYTYMVNLDNLPRGYGNGWGNWDQQLFFSYDGVTDKEVTVRVLADKSERNVNMDMYNWSIGLHQTYYGTVCITDKDGEVYYPQLRNEEFALPDGEYHAEFNGFDYPVTLIDPESDFGKHMKEVYPDVEFTDKSNGFDFTVKDGKADKDLSFDFGPLPGKSNYITVNCIDISTGKPLPGVEMSVIECPDTYAKTIAKWTSDETGTVKFDGLTMTGSNAYKLQLDKVPEGYVGGFDEYYHWGYVYEYEGEANLYFSPVTEEKNVSADVLSIYDKSVMNDLCTYDVYKEAGENFKLDHIYTNVKPGEKIALQDGDYFAVLDLRKLREKGYDGILLYTERGKAVAGDIKPDEYMMDTAMLKFTVKDGKPDRDLYFYIKEYDEHDYDPEETEHDDEIKFINDFIEAKDEE